MKRITIIIAIFLTAPLHAQTGDYSKENNFGFGKGFLSAGQLEYLLPAFTVPEGKPSLEDLAYYCEGLKLRRMGAPEAEAVGLRVEIISGISRDIYGNVKNSGHAWIFAYTHDNYGLLMDPTWDAGTVNGRVFTRNTFHRAWFGVDPEWMILTRFPKNAADQLLPDPLSEDEFRSLNYGFSLQYIYGFDVHEMYTRARARTLSMPKIYSGGVGEFTIHEAPLQKELHVGHQYRFRVRMLKDRDLILTRNGTWYSSAKGQWEDEGDGVYSFICVPEYVGEVRLNLWDKGSDGMADTVIIYTVPEPTEEEKRLLSELKQDAAAVKSLQAVQWTPPSSG